MCNRKWNVHSVNLTMLSEQNTGPLQKILDKGASYTTVNVSPENSNDVMLARNTSKVP